MQRLVGNATVARVLSVARSARPAGMLVPEEDVSSALPSPGAPEAELPQGAAGGDGATLDETLVQRTIGDGHDLSNPRFVGDPVLEACFDNERTLKQGSNGPAVTKVQQALVDLGFPLPRFGVDGDFGTETKQSLQAFQRSATLSDDGIVGPNTMAQLDQRAPGGGGGGGGPTPPPTCTVTTTTVAHAPNASADTRTRVGPGELVDLTATGNSFWVPTAGTVSAPLGPTTRWTAPEAGGSVTITAVDATTGASCATTFTVVPPDSISMTRASVDPISAGQAGAGMLCEVDFGHTDVSFSRVDWLEVPGPPSGVFGYFAARQTAGLDLNHHPNPNFVPLQANNHFRFDHCASGFPQPPPFSFGGWFWSIPNRYRVVGSGATGTTFTTTIQSFFIDPFGTVNVSKMGASITRTQAGAVT
jgi:peptidoglycan hydrolase-like protein with peptidoglycan-binding domain